MYFFFNESMFGFLILASLCLLCFSVTRTSTNSVLYCFKRLNSQWPTISIFITVDFLYLTAY